MTVAFGMVTVLNLYRLFKQPGIRSHGRFYSPATATNRHIPSLSVLSMYSL